jgi:hydrogenase-4 membrane subunit HyfE
MTLPLVAFGLAAIVAVFFGRIRAAPFWLAVQALALAGQVVARGEPALHTAIALLEIGVVRGLLVPRLLRRAIRLRGEPDIELMPSNLFAWAIAIALVVLAFAFAAPVPVPGDGQALTLGVVGAAVALSLLVLATNDSPPAQLVAVLFMENALALFESLLPEPWPLPVHAMLAVVLVATVAVGGWLISTIDPVPAMRAATQAPDDGEAP